jgi:CHAD domain-containing protein
MKKLRYLVELMDERDAMRRGALRILRDAQEVLGRLHEREVLAARLERARRKHDIPAARALGDVLEAEARLLFSRYAARRPQLTAVAEALAARFAARGARRPAANVLAIGALALPSAAMILLAGRTRRAS